MNEPKRITVKEFREVGLLQELNRQFLHPLGMALEVLVEEDGTERFGGVWDYRDDPEGMAYRFPADRQRRGVNLFPPSALSDVDLALSTDRLDRVEQVLFRGALMATELGATLHQAAQLMKAGRLEWEAQLLREARQERGS